jgi:hypothetical protein
MVRQAHHATELPPLVALHSSMTMRGQPDAVRRDGAGRSGVPSPSRRRERMREGRPRQSPLPARCLPGLSAPADPPLTSEAGHD